MFHSVIDFTVRGVLLWICIVTHQLRQYFNWYYKPLNPFLRLFRSVHIFKSLISIYIKVLSSYTGASKGKYFLHAVLKPKDVHFLFSELYYSRFMLAHVSKNLVLWRIWAETYLEFDGIPSYWDKGHMMRYIFFVNVRLVSVVWGLWMYDCQ